MISLGNIFTAGNPRVFIIKRLYSYRIINNFDCSDELNLKKFFIHMKDSIISYFC